MPPPPPGYHYGQPAANDNENMALGAIGGTVLTVLLVSPSPFSLLCSDGFAIYTNI